MFETKALMLQVASVSVWLVMGWPWTVKLLKWTPLMFTVAELPCRLTSCLTSEATVVKKTSRTVARFAAVLNVGGWSESRSIRVESAA